MTPKYIGVGWVPRYGSATIGTIAGRDLRTRRTRNNVAENDHPIIRISRGGVHVTMVYCPFNYLPKADKKAKISAMELGQAIEAILFWKGEPVSVAWLAKATNKSEMEIKTALEFLESELIGRGVKLICNDGEVMLGTAPAASGLIERLMKEELSRDLGKASLETLTIILYKGPLSRTEIDYIRGVNSSFILRHLQTRGLIEKIANPNDARSYHYRPTLDLLTHLGVTKVSELPEHNALREKLEQFTALPEEEKSND